MLAMLLPAAACVNAPTAGSLGEGSSHQPAIVAVDSAVPPRAATIRLGERAHAALLLVAPGHSSTLLWPPDSTTDNELGAGSHRLAVDIPDPLLRVDTVARQPGDVRIRTRTRPGMSAIPPETRTYLLLVTSPRPLVYRRMLDVTAGVSIPIVEIEALNAVAKAVKGTIPDEPRPWSAHYVPVALFR
jgi:hypothetical protein